MGLIDLQSSEKKMEYSNEKKKSALKEECITISAL